MTSNFALAIHGGAGNITPQNLSPELEQESLAALQGVLEMGYSLLSEGGKSLDVVEAAVRMLEDSPLFNAGKGACFNHEGQNELDASIMDGHTLQAGAVAGITTIRNPISAARAVMERSPHVLLIGSGAERFAAEQDLEIVDPSYFHTMRQYERWELARRENRLGEEKMGTVGAVAFDAHGNLAAATSTGGMVNKRYGRVGDSPIIGAGTYANNATCAVSATGHGEHFIRNVVAYDISVLMDYKGLSLQEAVDEVVLGKLVRSGGDGGVIAVDNGGAVSIVFNSAGMYRGQIGADGVASVNIFK
ncbi:isoaspartyl peptidase/L-asparaginase [bacterium]|nr:MAG: isoaspartyl peptidase/L-asparaginase [bacterium]